MNRPVLQSKHVTAAWSPHGEAAGSPGFSKEILLVLISLCFQFPVGDSVMMYQCCCSVLPSDSVFGLFPLRVLLLNLCRFISVRPSG